MTVGTTGDEGPILFDGLLNLGFLVSQGAVDFSKAVKALVFTPSCSFSLSCIDFSRIIPKCRWNRERIGLCNDGIGSAVIK